MTCYGSSFRCNSLKNGWLNTFGIFSLNEQLAVIAGINITFIMTFRSRLVRGTCVIYSVNHIVLLCCSMMAW